MLLVSLTGTVYTPRARGRENGMRREGIVPQLPMFYMGPGFGEGESKTVKRGGGGECETALNKLYISTKRKRHTVVYTSKKQRPGKETGRSYELLWLK